MQEYNRELPEVVDYEALKHAICSLVKNNPRLTTLFVEGFLLFHDAELDSMFHKRLFLTISKKECFLRRQRTLPCTPRYFAQVLWPSYLRNNAFLSDKDEKYVTIVDAAANPEALYKSVVDWIFGGAVESLCELHRSNVAQDVDLERYYTAYDELGMLPQDTSLFSGSLSENEFTKAVAALRHQYPQPLRPVMGDWRKSPGNLLFSVHAGVLRAFDISSLESAPPSVGWELHLFDAEEFKQAHVSVCLSASAPLP